MSKNLIIYREMGEKSKRHQRYFQKLAELEDKKEFIEENLGEEKKFLKDRVLRKAMYKEFQELVEIISDLSAMIVKDKGKVVEDDYSNMEKLSKILGFDEKLIENLKKANGLRNILVHEYNGIIDRQAYYSIKEILPSVKEFGEKLEKWLEI